MKIFLYNAYNNGDLFFNQPIVKNLCVMNPNHSFTMCCRYNSFIFSDIDQLVITHDMTPFMHHIHVPFFMIGPDTLAINLWIGALAACPEITNTAVARIECNLEEYVRSFQKLLNYIEQQTNHPILLQDFDLDTYLPVIPRVDISTFLVWKSTQTKTLVFYYNYQPKSNQTIPVTDHDSLLYELCQFYPNCMFIIPSVSVALEERFRKNNLFNYLDCTKFDCKEDSTCKNLAMLEAIREECNYSIHFDIGACFYYINTKSITSKNKCIHVGANDYFYNRFITYYPFLKDKVQYLEARHVSDVYLKLQDIL
jgi:hypothetical protein